VWISQKCSTYVLAGRARVWRILTPDFPGPRVRIRAPAIGAVRCSVGEARDGYDATFFRSPLAGKSRIGLLGSLDFAYRDMGVPGLLLISRPAFWRRAQHALIIGL